MVINPQEFPQYSESHYMELMSYKTPIQELNGYRVKDKIAEQRGLSNGRHLTFKETEELLNQEIRKKL